MAWNLRRHPTEMGQIMKRKIIALGLLSLCSLALFAGESSAFYGLFPYRPWHPHNRYVTQITCRPYNAFTPICWGNLICDGCNPNPCGVASGCLPMTMGVPPWASSPGCAPSCGAPMGNFSSASDMPYMQPAQPMPDIRSAPFSAPTPMPVGPNISMYPPNGVSQANYNPYAQPYANYYTPSYYNPYQAYQPMPYYWYNGR
jgi:hypothetical protein